MEVKEVRTYEISGFNIPEETMNKIQRLKDIRGMTGEAALLYIINDGIGAIEERNGLRYLEPDAE